MKDLSPKPGDLDPIETASVDEIRALQLDRLKWSLSHAYENVAHYKAAFDAAGVHPDDLKELSDLAKFPFTTKAHLRDAYPFNMFAVPREQIARIHAAEHSTRQQHGSARRAEGTEKWAPGTGAAGWQDCSDTLTR